MVSKKLIFASLLSVFAQSFANIDDAQYAGIFFSPRTELSDCLVLVSKIITSNGGVWCEYQMFLEQFSDQENPYSLIMKELFLQGMQVKIDYSQIDDGIAILKCYRHDSGILKSKDSQKKLATIELRGWKKEKFETLEKSGQKPQFSLTITKSPVNKNDELVGYITIA